MLPREVRGCFFQERQFHLQFPVTALQFQQPRPVRHFQRQLFPRMLLPVCFHPESESGIVYLEFAGHRSDRPREVDHHFDCLFLELRRIPFGILAPRHLIPHPFRRRSYWIPVRKLRGTSTIEIIFDRQVRGGRRRPTGGVFKTKVITRGVDVTVNAFYKHSRIKQYLKDGRALRIETVINAPGDLGCQRRLHNLDELQARARAVNARLLQTERAGQACVLANPVFERIAHPSVNADGRRATAMRFGDSRVQALAGALCVTLCAVTGITNRSLRALMTGLLGAPYSMAQASYDLARLRRNGLITRRPHANTYDLTPDGLAFAIFYTKVHDRVLAPLFTAGQPQAPPQLRTALRQIEHHIDERLAHARLPAAA